MDNRCVGCGEIVPEGRQVCPNCEKGRPAEPREIKSCEPDYRAFYDKHREEIACLQMKLADSEERCRMLQGEVTKLSAIKATVEVIFGRKFDV